MKRRRPSTSPDLPFEEVEEETKLDGLRKAFQVSTDQAEALKITASRVIGASAGTGKTHTLTAIYLGLLYGVVRVEDSADEKNVGLLPSQIVAVTFTEKAGATGRRLAAVAGPVQE